MKKQTWAKVFQNEVRNLGKELGISGLTVLNMRDKVQIKVRNESGQTTVIIPFEWSEKKWGDAYTRVRIIATLMQQGHGLLAAANMAQGKAPKKGQDWQDILEKFKKNKTGFGNAISETTWDKDYKACYMAVDVMAAKNPPSDPITLMEMCLKDWKPATRTRQIRARALSQFLTFAVDRCNLADTWLPPARLKDLIGVVKKGEEPDKIAGDPFDNDQQILDLLASLPTDDPDKKVSDAATKWFNALCLMAELGLRPIEVGKMISKYDPELKRDRWFCTHSKKGGNGSTDPRFVKPLPLIDRDGNLVNWNLFDRFKAGLLPLPENIDGDAFRSYLIRKKHYVELKAAMKREGKNLVNYSFRHYYSLRSHIANIDVGTVCKSMGHNYEAHVRAYPYAKASNVDTAFDDGIERLLKMAKNQKLKETKA
ncbi:site-specific integrase [Prochlorococcus marinus XMU1414]|uniref:Site-specific integrase n=1 Tax=Prochlorococcus marinus XMU1424 TaxID=2774497 RepID=A0A9D9BXB8_PROMR|nr:site-specific integrase [Prochlorococcus marinus]MBO8228509.1 site-specific integrase [Prochlorococcus marinus XMU1414]MBW3045995.1 hypothetical protein [Prochlorococcus marinus str. MU1414]MCR8531719.1 site-specific integrase [Prochlorococcus marinus XMU1420]MCR8535448.1 site-specific integrase [Prochlorococcus marinus XMU1424]